MTVPTSSSSTISLPFKDRIDHTSSMSVRHRRESPTIRCIYTASIRLLLLSSLFIAKGQSQPDNVTVQDCYDNLYVSDANGDGRVDSEEYITFVQLEGPVGFLNDTSTFIDLPMLLQSNFYTLACLCSRIDSQSDDQCCLGSNAHINSTGTAPGDIPTNEQIAYLDIVCDFTGRAVEMVIDEQMTSSPTAMNGTTLAPSLAPSPSSNPATVVPTPTPGPVPVVVTTFYSIIVPNDTPQRSYKPDLISALDLVSQDVAATLKFGQPQQRRRRMRRQQLWGWQQIPRWDQRTTTVKTTTTQRAALRPSVENDNHRIGWQGRRTDSVQHYEPQKEQQLWRRRRRLEIVVTLPTVINAILDVGFTDDPLLVDGVFAFGPCPNDLANTTTDQCGQVTASVTLELTEGEDPTEVYKTFLSALNQAILAGDLGVALTEVAPNSIVTVASGEPSGGGPSPTGAPITAPSSSPDNGGGGGGEDDDDDGGGLSTGAIAGIAVAGCALFLLAGFAMIKTAAEDPNKKKTKTRKRPYKGDDPEAGLPAASDGNNDGFDDEVLVTVSLSQKLELDKQEASKGKADKATSAEAITVATTAGTLFDEPQGQSNLGQETRQVWTGQVFPEEAKQSEDELEMPPVEDDSPSMLVAAVPYISPTKYDDSPHQAREIEFTNSDDMDESFLSHDVRSTGGISHESEAGWSETYTSSMGTMSDDEMLPDVPGQSALSQPNIVMLGATNALSDGPGTGDGTAAETKLEDLANAIMEGDWVAVGATATALASMQSDSQSKSDFSKSTEAVSAMSSLRSDRWKDAIDQDKAAELDQLIESGDWEGIIRAASKFEAENTGMTFSSLPKHVRGMSSGDEVDGIEVHEDNSEDDEESNAVYSGSHISSKYTPTSGQTEEGNIPKRSREEIRAEVLALVQEVVPEEVDHVDEMMDQFYGRESELLETLVTMQQRAAAQQARNASSPEKSTFGADALKSPEAAALARKASSSPDSIIGS